MDNCIFDEILMESSIPVAVQEGLILKAAHGKPPSVKISKDGITNQYKFKIINGKLEIATDKGIDADRKYLETVRKIHPYIRKYTPHMLTMITKLTDIVLAKSEEAYKVAFSDALSKKERIQKVSEIIEDCNIAIQKVGQESDKYLNKAYEKYDNDRDPSRRLVPMTSEDRAIIMKFMQNRKKIYEKLAQMLTKYNTEYTREPVLFSKAKTPAKMALSMITGLLSMENYVMRYIASNTSV